jgi:CspA family cold shock protein
MGMTRTAIRRRPFQLRTATTFQPNGVLNVSFSEDIKHGTVKWFDSQKGYGFIAPNGGGRDSFVHISAMERSGLKTLNKGDRVTYSVDVDQKSGKHCAVDIRLVA